MVSIESISNDVKVDPYDVVKSILQVFLNGRTEISFEELREFFSQYHNYFTKEDVKIFMSEVMAIQRDGARIDIQEIASLIRDDIECFAR